MNSRSLFKAVAFAGLAAALAPAPAAAGNTYDIFPTVIEGIADYDPWFSKTVVNGTPSVDGTITFDTKNLTNAELVPDLEAHADGSITGFVDVEVVVVGKGAPVADEVPVIGRSKTTVSEKGLVLPAKAIVNERSFAAQVSFAGTKLNGAGGNAFGVKFAGRSKESVKPSGTTGSRDLTAKVSATVGTLHKGKSVVVVDVDDVTGIELAYGVFYGDDPVTSSGAGKYAADAFFLSDFAPIKGLSDGSFMSLTMTARRVNLPFPKLLPGQYGKFAIKAADGTAKFSGKGYHFKTAQEIQAAGLDLDDLIGGAGYLGWKYSGPAGSNSRSLGIGGAIP